MVPSSGALSIDLYQLTMAYGYFRLNMHEREATFHLLFRHHPYKGHFALSCGLATVIHFLKQWHFTAEDLQYIVQLSQTPGFPSFPKEFIDYLKKLRFSCHISAIPEGLIVFAQEPLLRIEGPLLQCQLLESPLLNIINFQTLIATKAARVCHAAGGDPVIEFGMRRAQGLETSVLASRAAYIGGCVATSNMRAGQLYGIPVRGTHAHSWVTAFDGELEAFEAYARVMPDQCILLVDTYDSLKGTLHAMIVGQKLRAQGHRLLGIRLDSGDMATISIQVRKLLDEQGFTDTLILASNALDEHLITSLKQHGAKISAWGVGTHLVTAYDQPALDGVYKLSALRDQSGNWQYKLKLSEQLLKISNPGRHQVRRYFHSQQKRMEMDLLYDLSFPPDCTPQFKLLTEQESNGWQTLFSNLDQNYVDLLQPVYIQGQLQYSIESLHTVRERATRALAVFYATYPETQSYPVGIEKALLQLKQQLVEQTISREGLYS